MLNRIQRYILRECISGLVLVLGIFVLAIVLVDVVEQSRTVGTRTEITLQQAISLSLMKLPMLIEQTLPFAILVAAMIAFSRLNKRSELPIIRASGISAWRFLTPLILLALTLGLFTTTILNPIGADLTARFEAERAALLREQSGIKVSGSGIWLRQGDSNSQIVINAKGAEDDGIVLTDVIMTEEERQYYNGAPTEHFGFKRRIDAERARLLDGFWQLEGVREYLPGGKVPSRREFLSIPTNLDANKLLDKFASPNTIGFWELPGFISQTTQAGLDAQRYSMRWWALTSLPALFTAMALIGALACLRLSRLGGTPQLVAIGAGLAIGLFFITQFSSSLGSTGAAPPFIAAWAPSLFALFVALSVIAYKEDG